MAMEDASASRGRAERTIPIYWTAATSATSGGSLLQARAVHCWEPKRYASSKLLRTPTAHSTVACLEVFSTPFQNQAAITGTAEFTNFCGTARWTRATFL